MSYWRKLFIVVLLVLSLPVQSFAAVSMACDNAQSIGHEGVAHRELVGNLAHRAAVTQMAGTTGHHDHAAMMAAQAHRVVSAQSSDHGASGGAHHAHACPACAACCFGGALPNAAVTSASFDPVRFSVPLPPAVRVASFLTGGIERPPRISLV
ncbi:hypothetical protein [Paraburkholderia sp. D15]|uniref:hypothetical protein n=1 Tax=Paraburkholderia sp. D15 TaxID=2880218 RepID=UPI0032B07180